MTSEYISKRTDNCFDDGSNGRGGMSHPEVSADEVGE